MAEVNLFPLPSNYELHKYILQSFIHSILSDHWVVYSFLLLEISEHSSACLWWKQIHASATEYFPRSGVKRSQEMHMLSC